MANDVQSGSWLSSLIPDCWNSLTDIHCQVCDPILQKIFRIFLSLADRSAIKYGARGCSGGGSPPWIHLDEVKLFVAVMSHHFPFMDELRPGSVLNNCAPNGNDSKLYHCCGLDAAASSVLASGGNSTAKAEHTFKEFVRIVARLFPYNRDEFAAALEIVYDKLVNQVLKKGYLLWSRRKSGGFFGRWERRWVVVKPGLVIIYRNQGEQEKLKEVVLSSVSTCKAVDGPSSSITAANGFPLYEFELKISSGKRRYLATYDILERRQWITAIECALRNCQRHQPPPPLTSSNGGNNINAHSRRAFLMKRRQARMTAKQTTNVPLIVSHNHHDNNSTEAPPPISPETVRANGATAAILISAAESTTYKTNSSLHGGEVSQQILTVQERSEVVVDKDEEEYWSRLTLEALCKELRKERLRANRLALEKKRLQDELECSKTALKDEEIVRQMAARLFEEERGKRTAVEEVNKHYAIDMEEQRQQREQSQRTTAFQAQEIQRLRTELNQVQDRMKSNGISTCNNVKLQSSSASERRRLIENVRRQQQALFKHHQELKHQLLQQKLECGHVIDDAKSAVIKLIKTRTAHDV